MTRCGRLRVKRLLDLLVAFLGVVILSPLLLGLALVILVSMGRPVLFRQERPGLDGTPFYLVKFRTMRPARPHEIWFRSDKDRLTFIGRLIRKLSLDELPTLWNVLRGHMSLVGPRPLLMDYLPKYSSQQFRRHEMRPGITGWAQVNGRQGIPFSQRLELDLWYVDHWSLALDLRILVKTIAVLLVPTGVIPGQDLDAVDDLGFSADHQVSEDQAKRLP
jgi:sugar transferase EpsL